MEGMLRDILNRANTRDKIGESEDDNKSKISNQTTKTKGSEGKKKKKPRDKKKHALKMRFYRSLTSLCLSLPDDL